MSRFPGNIIKLPNVTPTQSSASGVWSLKDQMVYQRNNLWPFQRDPYFNYTTLLLQGNVPNTTGPQAMNLPLSYNADASTNNFLVTPNGDVGPRPFSPYFNNYSGFFESTASYVRSTSNVAAISGDFTIEGWVFWSASSGAKIIAALSSDSIDWWINAPSGTISYYTGAATRITTSAVVPQNSWTHVALVRSSGVTKIYINGVADGATYSSSATIGSGSEFLYVGRDSGTSFMAGYLSNVRLVIGRAVYTSNFVPETIPLGATTGGQNPPQGTETKLLILQSNRFIDNATSGLGVSVVGTPRITDNSPFVSTDFTTGAGYFDGTTDYLNGATNTATAFNLTGDFTIEMWIYCTDIAASPSGGQGFISWSDSSGWNGWQVYHVSGSLKFEFLTGSTGAGSITSSTITNSQWVHIAVVRSGTSTNNINFYVNGTANGSASYNSSQTSASSFIKIGTDRTGTNYLRGYIAGLRVVNGTAVYTGNFSPPSLANLGRSGATSIAAYPSTTNVNTSFAESATALLTLQTRSPSQNINFIDSSPNEFIVTKNGNTTQGTFSPFSPTGWGNYFAGSNNYLSAGSNTAFDFGTGDFTIESWIYTDGTTETFGKRVLNKFVSNGWLLEVLRTSGNTVRFLWLNSSNTTVADIGTNDTLSPFVWHHIAVSRSGANISLYVDGARKATSSSVSGGTDNVSNTLLVGSANLSDTYFDGYISNARIVKGTAVYDPTLTTLTVPTAPLSVIANTSLLTCQSNRFIDQTGKTITPTNSPSVQAFSPFAPANAVSPLVTGGSGYFDGVVDYLSATSNAAFGFGTGDFTVEAWVYITGGRGERTLFVANATNGANIFLSGAGSTIGIGRRGVDVNNTFGSTPTSNSWNHVAVARSGTSITCWVNGAVSGTQSQSNSINYAQGAANIGAISDYADQEFGGYISSLRVVKGTAVYNPASSTITIPTAPLTAITNTSLLLNFTNGAAVDATGKNNLESVGKTQLSKVQAKWNNGTGGASLQFDGSTGYLFAPANKNNDLTGNFTIEAWIYFNSVGNGQIITAGGGAISGAFYWQYYTSQLQFGINGVGVITNPSWSPSAGTWYFVTVTRTGTTVRQFVDGTQLGTDVSSSQAFVDANTQVGYGGAGYFNGYISNLRVSKYARYTVGTGANAGKMVFNDGSNNLALPTGPFPIG